MKAPFATIIAFLVFQISHSQNVIKVNVQDSLSKEALIGVTVQLKSTINATATDVNGQATLGKILTGKQTLVFSFVGYHKKEIMYDFPLKNIDEIQTVLLASEAEALEEVIVSATRTNSRIEDLPMKVEVC